MAVTPHRLVLLGPPASGKGTQGQLMTDHWRVPVVSAGEVLRAEIAAGTPLGREAAHSMNDGGLVPDRVALTAMEAWLARCGGEFVLDGFPRTVGQAEALEGILAQRGQPLTGVLWLELHFDWIAHRVMRRVVCPDCGRSFQSDARPDGDLLLCPACGSKLAVRHDDNLEALARRMEEYTRHTHPLVDFYEGRGLLRRINAEHTPEEVFAEIEAAVEAAQPMTGEAATVP